MDLLIKMITEIYPQKEMMKEACRRNGMKIKFLSKFSISKINKIIGRIESIKRSGFTKNNSNWIENELQLFHYTLLIISAKSNLLIKNFSNPQWNLLQEIFPTKTQRILQYEALTLIAGNRNVKVAWTSEEDNLISQFISKENQDPNWNQIAVSLFYAMENSVFRTAKQCKERWNNHLDPSIKHGDWSAEEDALIIKSIFNLGKRWYYISKKFNGTRTEHMVKNRFLSLCVKMRKFKPQLHDQNSILKELRNELGLNGEFESEKSFHEDFKSSEDEEIIKKQCDQKQIECEDPKEAGGQNISSLGSSEHTKKEDQYFNVFPTQVIDPFQKVQYIVPDYYYYPGFHDMIMQFPQMLNPYYHQM